jgi:DNA-binding NarL/FixJ family response regulator
MMRHNGRRICLISSASVQNHAFLEFLQERTGIECVMRSELRRTATSATLADHDTLILVDCQFIDSSTVVQQVQQLPTAVPPNVVIAMINVYDQSSIELSAVTHGVRGLFDVSADTQHLLRGIAALFDGDVWIPRRVLVHAAYATHDGERKKQSTSSATTLTRREREILTLITTGASNDEIAARLGISSNTVRTHVYNLYRKIEVPNRMQAALWGAENL